MAMRIVAAASALGWTWLALARGWFWRTDVRLPKAGGPDPDPWPRVAVLVPARDEASVLPITIPSLLAQDYPGQRRVIVVDDNSTDATSDLLAQWPVEVVRPGEPPDGWAGKLWALSAGIATAEDVDYLLLTDADIAHRPDSLRRLVAAAESGGYQLVSQMARLRVRTGWERLIVPAFVFFFSMLFPFRWSNRAGTRTAAAAGGCSLVHRPALAAAGGLTSIRDAVIDDVALARLIKSHGGRTFLGLADRVDSVRPYPGLGALWQMVSRSAYAQLRYSVLVLAGTVAGLGLMFWVPPAAVIAGAVNGDLGLLAVGSATWSLMSCLYAPMLRYYRLPVIDALVLPVTATLYLGMTVDSAIQHARGRGAAWKGRTYAK